VIFKEKSNGLTSNTIKIIAIIAMTIDHITWRLFPGFQIAPLPLFLHLIGRLKSPIMMFFIVEGYYHTKNIKKYVFRMFLFAVISHIPFAIFVGTNIIPLKDGFFEQTSVIWGFLMGLISLAVYKSTNAVLRPWLKALIICLCIILAVPANWSVPTVFAILFMGINYGNFKKQMFWLILSILIYSIVYIILFDEIYGILQMGIILAIPVLACYKGERGSWKGMKWLFYVYYPLHLLLLGLIRIFILK
jgi:hypothetical protein